MKVLYRTGPSIDPWSTPLIIGLQLDFMPLITTLWDWPIFTLPQGLLIQPILQHLLYEEGLMGHNI